MRPVNKATIGALCAVVLVGATNSRAVPSGAVSQFPDDLQLLVGKHIVLGRLPVCTPSTYTANLAYAGKPAKVLSFEANKALRGSAGNLSRMPPNLRPMIADAKKGGILKLQFQDGKIFDTCGDLLLSQLSAGLTLAAGETVPLPASTPAESLTLAAGETIPLLASTPAKSLTLAAGETIPLPASTPAKSLSSVPAPVQTCPMVITGASSGVSLGHSLIDALTTSEFQTQLDEAAHGGKSKHYLDIRASNSSQKAVQAFEFVALYQDKMGDETTSSTYVSQNTRAIKPGDTYKASAMDRDELAQNGAGKITLSISRVRFGDDTVWQDNGSHSCSLATVTK
jgi:hypothetical protein